MCVCQSLLLRKGKKGRRIRVLGHFLFPYPPSPSESKLLVVYKFLFVKTTFVFEVPCKTLTYPGIEGPDTTSTRATRTSGTWIPGERLVRLLLSCRFRILGQKEQLWPRLRTRPELSSSPFCRSLYQQQVLWSSRVLLICIFVELSLFSFWYVIDLFWILYWCQSKIQPSTLGVLFQNVFSFLFHFGRKTPTTSSKESKRAFELVSWLSFTYSHLGIDNTRQKKRIEGWSDRWFCRIILNF